jgi:hypothetical protein
MDRRQTLVANYLFVLIEQTELDDFRSWHELPVDGRSQERQFIGVLRP